MATKNLVKKNGLYYTKEDKRPAEWHLADPTGKKITEEQYAWYLKDCVDLATKAERIKKTLNQLGVKVDSCSELTVLAKGETPSARILTLWIEKHLKQVEKVSGVKRTDKKSADKKLSFKMPHEYEKPFNSS